MRTIERIDPPWAGWPLTQLLLPLLALAVAFVLLQTTPAHALLIALAVAVFSLALISTPVALYLLIFSMLLSPEFVVSQMGGKGTLGRGLTLRLDDLLLLLIGVSWFIKTALHKELGLVVKTPLNRAILLYMTACVASTALGMAFGRVSSAAGALYTLKYFEYFFVYFMVVNHVQSAPEAKRYLIAALVTAGIVSVYAILQIPSGGRASAPFEGDVGEPNTLGGYLVLILAVVGGLLLSVKEQGQKLLLGAFGVLLLVALSATLSRSSYLALGVALLVLVAFNRQKVMLAVSLALLIALSPFIAPERVRQRVSETFTQRYHGPQEEQLRIGQVSLDTSTSARIISWKTSARDWLSHPVFGYGIAGYGFIDAQYFKVLVETGLVGLAAFGFLLGQLWRRLLAAYRTLSAPWMRGLAMGFIAGYAGMLAHAIGANTFIIVRIMEPFWLLAGLLIVLSQAQEQTREEQRT
ncbi:MAG: O-antigen ligase family protein [Nitrospirota bacterium]